MDRQKIRCTQMGTNAQAWGVVYSVIQISSAKMNSFGNRVSSIIITSCYHFHDESSNYQSSIIIIVIPTRPSHPSTAIRSSISYL